MVCVQRYSVDCNKLNPDIVCYLGGTCGDLISTIMDPSDCVLLNGAVSQPKQRQRLKKPHDFANTQDKDQYLISIANKYKSVPSHDLNYHKSKGHLFLSIVTENLDTAYWAADRFRQLHRPQVWEEMKHACGACTVKDYAQTMIDFSKMVASHTQKLIPLDLILKGQAVDQLEYITKRTMPDAGKEFYTHWLECQML